MYYWTRPEFCLSVVLNLTEGYWVNGRTVKPRWYGEASRPLSACSRSIFTLRLTAPARKHQVIQYWWVLFCTRLRETQEWGNICKSCPHHMFLFSVHSLSIPPPHLPPVLCSPSPSLSPWNIGSVLPEESEESFLLSPTFPRSVGFSPKLPLM